MQRASAISTRVTLGGQKEEMYEETDSVAIGRAFRRAGKAVEAHVES